MLLCCSPDDVHYVACAVGHLESQSSCCFITVWSHVKWTSEAPGVDKLITSSPLKDGLFVVYNDLWHGEVQIMQDADCDSYQNSNNTTHVIFASPILPMVTDSSDIQNTHTCLTEADISVTLLASFCALWWIAYKCRWRFKSHFFTTYLGWEANLNTECMTSWLLRHEEL